VLRWRHGLRELLEGRVQKLHQAHRAQLLVHLLAQPAQGQARVPAGVRGDGLRQDALQWGVGVVEGLEIRQSVQQGAPLPLVMPMENRISVV
jgi:hypothetical protein